MVQVGTYQQATGYYNTQVNQRERQKTDKGTYKERAQSAGYVDKSRESTLSQRAQDLLKQLRSKYGNMDFMVADFANGDDAKEILSRGTKEFSVLFSGEELEKMASNEKYLKQKMESLEGAVRMSEEINQKYGFERAFGKGGSADTAVTKIGIAFHDDGTTSFFAELEKSSAKQRERIEAAREEKRAQKKAEDRKAEKELQSYSKGNTDVKRTAVEADSMEELLKKIAAVDWDAVKSEKVSDSGSKCDFSI